MGRLYQRQVLLIARTSSADELAHAVCAVALGFCWGMEGDGRELKGRLGAREVVAWVDGGILVLGEESFENGLLGCRGRGESGVEVWRDRVGFEEEFDAGI